MNNKLRNKLERYAENYGLCILHVSRLNNKRDYRDAQTCIRLMNDELERTGHEVAIDWDATADIAVAVRRVR